MKYNFDSARGGLSMTGEFNCEPDDIVPLVCIHYAQQFPLINVAHTIEITDNNHNWVGSLVFPGDGHRSAAHIQRGNDQINWLEF